jgi:methionyl-tRNA formyltransferase
LSDGNSVTRLTFLVNNPEAWVKPLARRLVASLSEKYDVSFVERSADVPEGDVSFFLGCSKLVRPEVLRRHRHNLVVHGSDLPQGRGSSPIPWQVLEGKNRIPIVMFEAVEALDAGPVYFRDVIELDGSELIDEIRHKTWLRTEALIRRFLERYPDVSPSPQQGPSSQYRPRTTADDELDPEQPLAALFDHLRIVDNERYPAWFRFRGHRYTLRISKEGE